jgi:hypothetical protein
MRYGDGGGVNQAGRLRREQIRQRAAAMFDTGIHPTELAAASGLTLKPAKARTWARRGHTPIVKMPGARGPRISIRPVSILGWVQVHRPAWRRS